MHIITNLNEWGTTFLDNPVFAGCCDAELELIIELDPADADHEIDVIYLNTGSVATYAELIEIGGVPYTGITGNNWNVDISPNFVLTQGNQLSIKLKYCFGAAVGSIQQMQLTLQCANHGGYHIFQYSIEGIDIVSAYTNIIAESTAIFNDCQGICNVKKDLLHFNNPSNFNLPVTCTLTTTCGFAFFIDGNPIDITDFQMPPGQSVLQISNPGCAVAAPCNFDFAFDFCGNVVNIPVTHDLSYCNPCGLDCRGITINSNPISMPKISYAPNYSWDNNSGISNYAWQLTAGVGSNTEDPTKQLVTSSSTIAFSSNISPYGTAYYPFIFSPNIIAGDDVNIYWYLETKDVLGSTWQIEIDGTIAGLPNIVIIPSGSVAANTIYQGTINIPSFVVPPGPISVSAIYINNATPNSGDYIEIANRSLQIQKTQKPNLVTTANLDCSTLNTYNTTAVGDSKTITFQLYYANEFKDFTRVWFNPWMFDAAADYTTKYGGGAITEPQSGWVIDVMSSMIGTGIYPMTYPGPNNQLNYGCYINIINDHDFEIIFDFFLIQDLKDWVDLYDLDNNRKLLYTENTPLAPYLQNVTNSVYLNQKAMGYLIYIYDPNIIQGYTPTTPPKPVYYECALDRKVMFDVRWWNQGLNGGLPEMSNPTFSFTRNTNPVTELSTINPTDVTFTIFYPGVIDNVVFWLFDESNTDNSINFYVNYDSSRALIPTITTPGVIDNHLESPSQAVTAIGGGYYSVSCRISKTLNPLGTYRLGAICYSSATDIVNSFLSDQLSVKTSVDIYDICCPLDVDVHWLDAIHDYNTSCFMPTLKERIKNDMYVTGGNFDTCLQNLGMPAGNNFLDYLVGVVLTIYQKRDTYPTVNDRSYFLYGTYTSDKDPLTGIWDNPYSELFCSDDGTTLYTSWAGRVLWNDTPLPGNQVFVGPMNQYYNRTQLPLATGNSYVNFHNVTWNWADQDIYFEYNFLFNLETLVQGSTGVYLAQVNQLHPTNYDSPTNPYGQILDSMTVYGWKNGVSTLVAGAFCFDKYDYLEVTITESVGYTDGKLIATLNYAPYTEYNISENESFIPTNYAQSVDVEMYDVDSDFVGGVAKFKIDTSQLQPGNYQICAIRIPN